MNQKYYLLFPEENKAFYRKKSVEYVTKYYQENKDKVLQYKKGVYYYKKEAEKFRNILLD
jgi:hypothetical protein